MKELLLHDACVWYYYTGSTRSSSRTAAKRPKVESGDDSDTDDSDTEEEDVTPKKKRPPPKKSAKKGKISVLHLIVLASRASGCLLDNQTLKNHPTRTPKYFCEEFLKMSISSISLNFFHFNIIPMTLYKDIMPNYYT